MLAALVSLALDAYGVVFCARCNFVFVSFVVDAVQKSRSRDTVSLSPLCLRLGPLLMNEQNSPIEESSDEADNEDDDGDYHQDKSAKRKRSSGNRRKGKHST